ncbi:MAG: hypothetical protein ACHREM_13075, partial [Polyangiales bacterium]
VAIDRVAASPRAAAARSPSLLRRVAAASLALSTLSLCWLAALDRRAALTRVAVVVAFTLAQLFVFVGVGAERLPVLATFAPAVALVIALLIATRQLSSSG